MVPIYWYKSRTLQTQNCITVGTWNKAFYEWEQVGVLHGVAGEDDGLADLHLQVSHIVILTMFKVSASGHYLHSRTTDTTILLLSNTMTICQSVVVICHYHDHLPTSSPSPSKPPTHCKDLPSPSYCSVWPKSSPSDPTCSLRTCPTPCTQACTASVPHSPVSI